jgi:hypothetical protein
MLRLKVLRKLVVAICILDPSVEVKFGVRGLEGFFGGVFWIFWVVLSRFGREGPALERGWGSRVVFESGVWMARNRCF